MTTETALQSIEPTEASPLALMTLQPEQYAAEVYQPFKTRLAEAIESARNIDYDITTGKGIDVVTKARRTLMDIRIEANKQREERKAPIIKIGKLLESSYKAVEELVLPLETFFDGEIKAEEQRKEAEKQAKIAAERERVESIQARIKQFSDIVLQSAGQSSATIEGLQERLAEIEITEVDFEEFIPQATDAKSASASALEVAYEAAKAAEDAAEAARIKREDEDRQRAADAAKLEAQRAEQERIAAAQAAESKRLADIATAQAAELVRAQKEADDRIKAQAAAETARIQAEADARAAEHAKAMDELNRQRAEFEAQQQEAERVKALEEQKRQDAAMLEADHAEALQIDSERDASIKAYADALNSQRIADALISESLDEIGDLAELIPSDGDASPLNPTDDEIIAVYLDAFGGTREAAIDRLRKFFF